MKQRVLPAVDAEDLSPKTRRQVNDLQAFSEALIAEVHAFEEKVAHLNDALALLKGEKKRPVFKPSRMHEEAGKVDHAAPASASGQPARRPGSHKKSKTVQLKIDCDCIIEPSEPVPPGSRFKGYRDFTVQDLVITPKTRLSSRALADSGWTAPDRATAEGAARPPFRTGAGQLSSLPASPLPRHAAAAA